MSFLNYTHKELLDFCSQSEENTNAVERYVERRYGIEDAVEDLQDIVHADLNEWLMDTIEMDDKSLFYFLLDHRDSKISSEVIEVASEFGSMDMVSMLMNTMKQENIRYGRCVDKALSQKHYEIARMLLPYTTTKVVNKLLDTFAFNEEAIKLLLENRC